MKREQPEEAAKTDRTASGCATPRVRIRMSTEGGGFLRIREATCVTYIVSALPPLPVATRANTNDPGAAGCVPRGSA